MGVLADQLAAMRVSAVSPDSGVAAELRGRAEVSVRFAPGWYRRYDERGLETQLAGVARLLWAARMRAYYAAASAAFGQPVTREAPAVTNNDKLYYAARGELVARGRCSGGWLALAVRGMRVWTVRIADGALAAVSEEEFATGVGQASRELICDQFDQIRLLKAQIYG